MQPLRTALLLLLSICLQSAELLLTGSFHEGEIPATAAAKPWLALEMSGRGFVWRPARVVLRNVRDEMVDADGEKTGVRVSVPGRAPLLLVRGASIRPGRPVLTAFYSPEGQILPERDPLSLSCLDCGPSYELRLAERLLDENVRWPSRLVLEGDGITQVLYEWPEGFSDQHAEIVWAAMWTGTAASICS